MTKTKILYLSSSPSNLDTLGSDEEFRAIYENINDDFFKMQSVSKTKISDIQAVIYESQPDIIHFSGHGSSEDIIFETDQNESAGAFKPAFIRIFQNLKKRPRLIFLNACQTYHNLEDLSYIVDFVIATDRKVFDPTAIMFARCFYRFLSLGASVKSSFNLARNQFDLKSVGNEASPVREAVLAGDRFDAESLVNEAKMYRLLVREGADDGIFAENSRHSDTSPEPSEQEEPKPQPQSTRGNNFTNNGSIKNQTVYQASDGATINHNQKSR